MRILLYSPDNGVTRNFMPHLWMFLLQALTPPGHEVLLIDGNAQPMDEAAIAQFVSKQNIGLVGIGAMTRDRCLSVRRHLWETWRNKLLHMPTSIHQQISRVARPNAADVRAPSVAGGLLPDPYAPARQTPRPSRLASASLPPLEAGVVTQPEEIRKSRTPVSNSSASATWETIEISFLSDERVQILNGTKRETCNYAELGFSDGRNGSPNKAWVILRAMAVNRGILSDGRKAGQAWPKVEKAIQEIRKALRNHFRISADPIPFVERVGYQAIFKIGCSPSFRT